MSLSLFYIYCFDLVTLHCLQEAIVAYASIIRDARWSKDADGDADGEAAISIDSGPQRGTKDS